MKLLRIIKNRPKKKKFTRKDFNKLKDIIEKMDTPRNRKEIMEWKNIFANKVLVIPQNTEIKIVEF